MPRLLLIPILRSAAARAVDVAFWLQLCDNTPTSVRGAHVFLVLEGEYNMRFSLAYEMQRPVVDDHAVIEETLEQ